VKEYDPYAESADRGGERVRRGVRRSPIARFVQAHCTECAAAWSAANAGPCAVIHSRTFGHATEVYYGASFRYEPQARRD